jgi:hypothetical protein
MVNICEALRGAGMDFACLHRAEGSSLTRQVHALLGGVDWKVALRISSVKSKRVF